MTVCYIGSNNNKSMGSASTKTVAQQLKIVDEQWEFSMMDRNRQVVKHRTKDFEGQISLIAADPLHSMQDELEIYNFRKQQEKALVQVYCADYLKSTHTTMCGNQVNIKVIYERIPVRLRDMPILTFPQAIYVLSQSLRGFQECYEKVGPFEVTDLMIGINSKGLVRVWLNEDFAENHPTSERPSLQITVSTTHKSSAFKQQTIFVRNIIEIIKTKLENKKFPALFQKALKDTNGFVETYCQLERYCEQMKIWVPDRIIRSSPGSIGESNPVENTVRKTANLPNESRTTYVPYMPASSRDTYVTPNLTKYEPYAYTPNSKRNQPMFRSAERNHQGFMSQDIQTSNVAPFTTQNTFIRPGYTYKPI